MYVYFDSDGVLKEIITERPFRVGDSKRNKIYVYWEGEHSPVTGWIKYHLPNDTDTTETCFFEATGEHPTPMVSKTIPTKPLRNLKYFSYDHTYVEDGVVKAGYKFYEITIPDAVLGSSLDDTDKIPTQNNMVLARIRFVVNEGLTELDEIDSDDTIETLGVLVFSVESNIGVITDSSINETQYNYLLTFITNHGDWSNYYTKQEIDDLFLKKTDTISNGEIDALFN